MKLKETRICETTARRTTKCSTGNCSYFTYKLHYQDDKLIERHKNS